jgi:threonine/homoserine/homoserine lactone efflux protein
MFPIETWLAYTAACVLLVLSPGPDNLLAISRGLSQGRVAACISGLSSGTGILFHVAAATFGLTLLMQTSAVAFRVLKLVGAGYLLWLGIRFCALVASSALNRPQGNPCAPSSQPVFSPRH